MAFGMENPVEIYRKKKQNEKVPEPKDRFWILFCVKKSWILNFRFLELEAEIHEREMFLREMTAVGQGQKYNSIIKARASKIICLLIL